MNTSLNKPTKNLITRLIPVLTFVLLLGSQAGAAVFTSAKSGNWNNTSTWKVGGLPTNNLPGASDDVQILAGHNINAGAATTVNSLNVAGTLQVMVPVGASMVVNSITANTSPSMGTILVSSGNLRVETNFSMTNTQFTINGAGSSVTFGGSNDFTRTTEYFQLINGGELIIENIGKGQGIKRQYNQGNILFPLGTTNGTAFTYTPVFINNREKKPATINATYAVSVSAGVYQYGSDGPRLTENAVDKTWSITLLKGDSDAEASFYWNAADQLMNFNPLNSQLAIFQNGAWVMYAPTTFSANPPSVSLAGLNGSVAQGSPSIPLLPRLAVLGGGITPLPVELVAFNAVKKNKEVVLTWETASEKNNKGYEVQSSADGKNYEALGFVPSHTASSNTNQRYAFTHKTGNQEGLVYYRLKQIDLDGTVAYYHARVVDLGRFTTAALAYPNPFRDEFRVELETTVSGPADVVITDMTGKTVYQAQHPLQKGTNNIMVALKNQPSGLYFLKAVSGNQTYTNRLMKQ